VLPQEEFMGFQFGAVLAFAVVAVLFALVALLTGAIIRPRFPNADKVSIYECGERPVGAAWYNFNPRFYLIALAFVIFEVDIALTFPVVVVYAEWTKQGNGWVALTELVSVHGHPAHRSHMGLGPWRSRMGKEAVCRAKSRRAKRQRGSPRGRLAWQSHALSSQARAPASF
jgi:NADH-quinone oxidoreductase subunit A